MPPTTPAPDQASPPAYWRRARRHLLDADPVLGRVIKAIPGATLKPRSDPFYSLARSIVGQQISVKAAESVWNKIEARAAPAAISPPSVAVLGEEALRGCGVTRQKAGYLASLAGHFLDDSLDVPGWRELDDEAVIAQLTLVKGIGRWTAEMFLIFHLLRPDVLPLADIGVQRAIGNQYNGGERLSDDQVVRLAQPWRPWRSVAVWYLWRSLDAIPVDY